MILAQKDHLLQGKSRVIENTGKVRAETDNLSEKGTAIT